MESIYGHDGFLIEDRGGRTLIRETGPWPTANTGMTAADRAEGTVAVVRLQAAAYERGRPSIPAGGVGWILASSRTPGSATSSTSGRAPATDQPAGRTGLNVVAVDPIAELLDVLTHYVAGHPRAAGDRRADSVARQQH